MSSIDFFLRTASEFQSSGDRSGTDRRSFWNARPLVRGPLLIVKTSVRLRLIFSKRGTERKIRSLDSMWVQFSRRNGPSKTRPAHPLAQN